MFTEATQQIQCTIGQIALDRPSDVTVLLKNDFCSDWAAVSPDGRWVAYESNVSGPSEIYVERYPALGGRQQISAAGGRSPTWSRDGRRLFFISSDGRQMFAVPVQSGATLAAGRPQVLFEYAAIAPGGGIRPYDVTPDGRFIIISSSETGSGAGAPPSLVLVQHWFEELKRLVPVN